MATTTHTIPDVPIPGGAIDVADWYDLDTEPARYFTGTQWVIPRDNRDRDTVVLIDGTQWADGRIERIISLDDDNLTVEQARQIAAALAEAADEVSSARPLTVLVTVPVGGATGADSCRSGRR